MGGQNCYLPELYSKILQVLRICSFVSAWLKHQTQAPHNSAFFYQGGSIKVKIKIFHADFNRCVTILEKWMLQNVFKQTFENSLSEILST